MRILCFSDNLKINFAWQCLQFFLINGILAFFSGIQSNSSTVRSRVINPALGVCFFFGLEGKTSLKGFASPEPGLIVATLCHCGIVQGINNHYKIRRA
jgi:hypothetical protein